MRSCACRQNTLWNVVIGVREFCESVCVLTRRHTLTHDCYVAVAAAARQWNVALACLLIAFGARVAVLCLQCGAQMIDIDKQTIYIYTYIYIRVHIYLAIVITHT